MKQIALDIGLGSGPTLANFMAGPNEAVRTASFGPAMKLARVGPLPNPMSSAICFMPGRRCCSGSAGAGAGPPPAARR